METACKTSQAEFQKFLTIQRVAAKTEEAYLRSVEDLSSFHNQHAYGLTNDQIQDFLHYNIQEKQLSWSSCNVLFCGLKKYYRDFLNQVIKSFPSHHDLGLDNAPCF